MRKRKPPRSVVEVAIREAKGCITRTAMLLGCSRPTAYRWIYQHGLQDLAGIRNLDIEDVTTEETARNHSVSASVNSGEATETTLEPMNAVAQEDARIPVTIRITPSLWKRTKKAAIDRDCSASDLAEKGLRALLAGDDKRSDPSGDER